MAKGEETRAAILARAFELATVVGVSGLSIGRLAEATGLSKSGLFAHFGSKEALEVAVVEEASRQFVQDVMVPALRSPRGEPRVRALFDRWLAWGQRPGGCFFVAASSELDDRSGPPRDALVQAIRDWIDELSRAAAHRDPPRATSAPISIPSSSPSRSTASCSALTPSSGFSAIPPRSPARANRSST